MLVKNWMSKGVMAIGVDDSIYHAIELQKKYDIHILPVIKKGKAGIVGIVTDRDIKRASVPDGIPLDIHEAVYLTSKIKVKSIMTFPVITVPPDHTLQETAEILTKNDISGVPVIDDKGQVVGIITQRDILRALLSVITMDNTGYQFAFKVKDRPGAVSDELIKVVHDHGGRIASIVTSYKKAPLGYRYAYIQVYNLDPEKLPQLIEIFKKKTSLLYVVDSIQDKKEVYGE